MKKVLIFLLISGLWACESAPKSIGDFSMTVFDNTNLYFDMAFKSDLSADKDSIIHLDAGRVIIKKVKLPTYEIQPSVTVSMTLKSHGDPWDKSGSLFVIPTNSEIDLIDFERGDFDLNQLNQQYPGITAFSNDSLNYAPNLELMRFMTPFGVGFFNDHTYTEGRKPPYIPHWEESVNWSQDITHLLPLLEEEVYVGVFIDTWTKEGYELSVSIDFTESTIPNHRKTPYEVLPLINTAKYASQQRLYDGYSKEKTEVDFDIPAGAKDIKLHYITTGHGGHSGGDEFVKKENVISIDGEIIKQFTPWRDDCASFRRYNPSSGTWPADRVIKNAPSSERIASSDLSRSNWCPGSDITPEVIALNNLSAGKHHLTVAIPEAQAATANENNYWMVSAYITYTR